MNEFVVHEHKALRAGYHHDLRLERKGVFKCWALPKGVQEDSGVRRLAAPVENHDLSYGKFEGNIPRGQYGAGKVVIWDQGTYETNAWTDTKIEITFHGKKLHGEYVLRWMEKMNNWLLWKY